MEFSKSEVEIIKKLISDWGWEYSLEATSEEVEHLRQKLEKCS